MSKVQHIARLHEESVQKIARGMTLPKGQRKHTTSHRWQVRVHPLVMAAAHKVRRPGQRIVPISEGEVLIINKEKKWHSE